MPIAPYNIIVFFIIKWFKKIKYILYKICFTGHNLPGGFLDLTIDNGASSFGGNIVSSALVFQIKSISKILYLSILL